MTCSHRLKTLSDKASAPWEMAVHNISQALKENGMWENTLFIFTNDNGEKYLRNFNTRYNGIW